MGPLTGIKVLDFTQFLSGPYCTMMLSDLGAEVIKLEHPPVGDPTRYVLPGVNKKSIFYSSPNRGKKSVLMDLKDDRQRAIFYEMVKTADVVISNFRPGTMEKYQCGFEDLKKINPKIVCTYISGYGQYGPWKHRAAFDTAVQAAAGIMSFTGYAGGAPIRTGFSVADILGGVYGCIGTITALTKAHDTGEGSLVDVAMMDAVMAAEEQAITQYSVTGKNPLPHGNRHVTSIPFGDYKTRDGQYLNINISTDVQFAKVCEVLGHPEMAQGEYKTLFNRNQHRKEVDALFESYTQEFDAAELMEMLEAAKIPYGPINTIEQVMNLPQIQARNMISHVTYPDGTRLLVPSSPFKMSGMEEKTEYTASVLGADTIEVLSAYADEALLHEIYDDLLEEAKAEFDKRTVDLDL